MGKTTLPLIAFNRGLVSPKGVARQDIKRIAMSATTQTNWIPRVLGSMSLRPGLGYKGATKSNAAAKMLEFVFSTSQKALLELTDSVLRVWNSDALVTRVAVSTAVTNGTFAQYSDTVTISNASPGVVTYATTDAFANDDPVTFTTTGALPNPLVAGTTYYVRNVNTGANTFEVSLTSGGASINTTTAGSGVHTVFAYNYVTGWTDSDESGATSRWAAGGYLELIGTGTNYAIRDQQVTVGGGDVNKEHALRIVITRGHVVLKIGTASGLGDYMTETLLTGTHSLAFTPTGNFWIRFQSNLERDVLIDSCTVEAAGVMELPTPWPASALDYVRFDQSADIVFVACDGYQQRRIERRSTTSWSVVLFQSDDGPFRVQNTSTTTMTPSVLNGNGTLTCSIPFFHSTHVGALFALTSNGQNVDKTVGAANDVTDSIRVTSITTNRAFTIVLSSLSGTGDTVILQRSFDDAVWTDVSGKSWTADTTESYTDGLDNQIVYYRLKCSVYAAGNPIMQLKYPTGSIRGICRVTGYTSTTVVTMEVLSSMGAITATDTWEEGQWSDYRGWPTSVALYEGRLWFAGRDAIVGSVSDAYTSFDDVDTTGDSACINRTVGGSQVDTINWILPLQRLVLGGEGAEYSCRSSSLDEPLTPTNFNPKRASTQGSAPVRAVSVDAQGVFVQRGGTRVYTVAADTATNGVMIDYKAQSLVNIIPEIGQPGINRIAVQRQPDTRIHCVRSDGTVALLIFDSNEQVTCWVEVETDGEVEDVAILPGDDGDEEDIVYYVVKRTINSGTVRYLERWAMESECVGGTLNKQADSFVTYTGVATTTVTAAHLANENVCIWADGADVGTSSTRTQTYTLNGSGQCTLPSSVTNYVVGLPYTASFESGKLLELQTPAGTSLSQAKAIRKIGLILADVHNKGLRFGRSLTESELNDMPSIVNGTTISANQIYTAYDQNRIIFPGTWDVDHRLCLKAYAPRPVTVLAADLTVEV